jgi:hypothetical protein
MKELNLHNGVSGLRQVLKERCIPASPRLCHVALLIPLCAFTALAQTPVITAVTNAADYSFTVAPGMIATVFGTALASSQEYAPAVPLPVILDEVSVTVNGLSAPLFYVSSAQINFQVPYETRVGAAMVQVSVTGRSISNAFQIPVASSSAGVFQYGSNRGIVQNQNSTLNTSANPAIAGSVVTYPWPGATTWYEKWPARQLFSTSRCSIIS